MSDTLEPLGKKIKRELIKYLKHINQHEKLEETLIINSTARAYELYQKYLDKAEITMLDDEILAFKLHDLSQKYYKTYSANLRTLGVTAIQRTKLEKTEDDTDTTDSLLEKVANRG